jgi:L-ascorbate metabolism protein UlaG (beta-lactamase superfamily)
MTGLPPADIVLVTDIHGDHLDPAAWRRSRRRMRRSWRRRRRAVAPRFDGDANGEIKTISGVVIEAVPIVTCSADRRRASCSTPRRNGYIVTLGGKRLYFAGDTECIPEMRALKNIDVAFIPMNLPYTMPPSEAADCVKSFKPKIVYPYHYMGSDLNAFADALKGSGVDVRIRNWY